MKLIYMVENGPLTYRGEYEAEEAFFDEGMVSLKGVEGKFSVDDFKLRDKSINDKHENNPNEEHFPDHIPGRD